jgi:hypothetical protein
MTVERRQSRRTGQRFSWSGVFHAVESAATFVALVVAIIAILASNRIADRQDNLAQQLGDASEVQENTRFIRQVDIENAYDKPFRSLNLRGATLSRLGLGCADTIIPLSEMAAPICMART